MRVPLTGGSYSAESLIANAQRCVNLYPEVNPEANQSIVPVTLYPTPGLTSLGDAPSGTGYRCLYTASNGVPYAVVGEYVYSISQYWDFTLVGQIAAGTTPVSMADNGQNVVIVDGTPTGYTFELLNPATFTTITDPAFYGATRADYIDTYLLFNRPGTRQFYFTLSQSISFDSLDIAAKIGYPDNIATLIVMHREIWLLGVYTTEIWYNSGAQDITFERMPGTFIEHGCCAPYSIAKYDLSTYWLSQNLEGQAIVIKGNSYAANRISNHAMEAEISNYSTITDAIGFTYQRNGHAFYVLVFPTADKTWVYDEATNQWHEWLWTDEEGFFHRTRVNCMTNAYGKNIAGDWENGTLYFVDPNTYNDVGDPIVRVRGFPHIMDDGKRIMYRNFIADMQVGEIPEHLIDNPPMVSLRWSDTRGASWGSPIEQSLGSTGQFLTSVQFNRLGMARDRVFELSWSADMKTALNGAFIDFKSAGT